MILQHLRHFEWLNEPQGVFFIDEGMKVVASPETYFIQNKHENIYKNNGHLFFKNSDDDNFCLTIKWSNIAKLFSSESGIMVRIDDETYAKCFISYDKDFKGKLFCTVTNLSNPDTGSIDMNDEIYLQIKKLGDLYKISYSHDLEVFELVREFYFVKNSDEVQIGAYLCNPTSFDFEATLSHIDLK